MDLLARALTALTSTLESQQTLAETVSSLERTLAHAFGIRSVALALGSARGAASADRCDVVCDLALDGEVFGRVTFGFVAEPTPGERERVGLVVAPMAVALAWRAQTGERHRLYDLLRTDSLTHLANRMAFDERLAAVWRRAMPLGANVTLALLDIDYFKTYNDIYGHVAGDDCLREVARALARGTRDHGGFVARYGGEEFAYISEALAPEEAVDHLARILHVFEEWPLTHDGSTLGRVSVSAGIAVSVPRPSYAIADFIREADRALYRAKAFGRNRIAFEERVTSAPVASCHARTPFSPPEPEGTTFGREAAAAQLVTALRHASMITLVGARGVGKSRLACVAARAVLPYASGGVAYVDLAASPLGVSPVDGLEAALAGAAGGDRERPLVEALRVPDTLLVIDNVAESTRMRAAALCESLLTLSSDVRLLVTSPVALGCRDERVVVVGPLDETASVELYGERSGIDEVAVVRALALGYGGNPEALVRAAGTHRRGATPTTRLTRA